MYLWGYGLLKLRCACKQWRLGPVCANAILPIPHGKRAPSNRPMRQCHWFQKSTDSCLQAAAWFMGGQSPAFALSFPSNRAAASNPCASNAIWSSMISDANKPYCQHKKAINVIVFSMLCCARMTWTRTLPRQDWLCEGIVAWLCWHVRPA